MFAGGVPYKSELIDCKTPGSIRSEVHESFNVHGSAFSAVQPTRQRPIQSMLPDSSWGFLGDIAEKEGMLVKSAKSPLSLKFALLSGDLEVNAEKKDSQSSFVEPKDDSGDSYNEDECVKTAVKKKELVSSEQTTKTCAHENLSGEDSNPQGIPISKKQNVVRQQLYRNKKKLKTGMEQLL